MYRNGPIRDRIHGHTRVIQRIAWLPIHSLLTDTHLDLCVAGLYIVLHTASHVVAIGYTEQAQTGQLLQFSRA